MEIKKFVAWRVPQIRKEGRENDDDDYGLQLNLLYRENMTQQVWFSKYLVIDPEAPKCMTIKLQKARAPQRYTKAPQEEYSNSASHIFQICIYRDTMDESPLLQQVCIFLWDECPVAKIWKEQKRLNN